MNHVIPTTPLAVLQLILQQLVIQEDPDASFTYQPPVPEAEPRTWVEGHYE